jgi:hypothetical protein
MSLTSPGNYTKGSREAVRKILRTGRADATQSQPRAESVEAAVDPAEPASYAC